MSTTKAAPPRPDDVDRVCYLKLKLAALGEPVASDDAEHGVLGIAGPLLRNCYRKDELLGWPLCPVDARIQAFLDDYLANAADKVPRLPARTLVLDAPGLGRVASLPASSDRFASPYLTSYRVAQGVLHNPKSDRRTTKGVFHVAEGGLPVPVDKKAAPKKTFALLLAAALDPPEAALTLPFTAEERSPVRVFVSLLLRPIVCPATQREPEKRMEVRFFAPGSLISNLDFVERIFGNAGDPFQTDNDAACDVRGFSGHTGCVILAPHLQGMTKRELGLPPFDEATPRQRRDGMCYREPDELYNDGNAFKITCRDQRGVIVTILADNYYGYCKKEVKTQISYAANLYGSEEEHAGGVLAYPSYVLGTSFRRGHAPDLAATTFEQAMALLGDRVELKPGRHAVDRRLPEIHYVPEDAEFDVSEGLVRWSVGDVVQKLVLSRHELYVLPSGYKIRLEKAARGSFRLIGSRAQGVLCHKPCTVSGGGKSEISKSLEPMIRPAAMFVKDFAQDFARVAEIVRMDFSRCYKAAPADGRARRPLLSPERSLGSVVKLFTPSDDYTDEFNAWLRELPQTIRSLVFTVKRYYRPEWGDDFASHFSVDNVNGYRGHELKFEGQPLFARHLRVGFEPGSGAWRMFKLRPDFHPADKVQVEDDISVSVVVPRADVPGLPAAYSNESVKVVTNCEEYLFQRPDDAVHRGFDAQAELDLATPDTFISNFEPLTREGVQALVDRVAEVEQFTPPMRELLARFAANPATDYAVSSAHPRLVDGKPSKNPRYLQRRPDRVHERATYAAEIGTRLHGEIPSHREVLHVVHAVLAGRRANRADAAAGLPPLAVFNPIHYQELPELFMDFMSSLTGKSPSTTGFGSEGALTKGPFNAVWPVVDLNNALISAILTGYAGFTSVAGYVGPEIRVDHDISMLVPELWCRMSVREREPGYLIAHGYLEKVPDFELEGRRVLASRLGYRITARFVEHFFGRMFETPNAVLTEAMLRPERQSLAAFAAGVDAIVETQTRVAKSYFEDHSIDAACPPLRALLEVMVHGHWQGRGVNDPEFRRLFTREALMQSDYYRARLATKQRRDIALLERQRRELETSSGVERHARAEFSARIAEVERALSRARSPEYLAALSGTLGADPFDYQDGGVGLASAAE
jgi:hypothetical protein